MQIHQIKFKLKDKQRIGRGGKRGNYSGRGIKGQKARAGHRIRPALRDFVMKIPKLRGQGNIKIKENIFEINLEKIDKNFSNGEKVSVESLQKKGLLKIAKSIKNFKIKILGKGSLTKTLIFDKSFLFSSSALEKINQSQSKIE